MSHSARVSLLFLLLTFGTGCVHKHMTTRPDPAALRAPSEAAVVIFAMGDEGRVNRNWGIVDEAMRCLGSPGRKRFFAARFSPGEHSLALVGDEARGARIHVEAGKTYLVEVVDGPDRQPSGDEAPFVVHPASSWGGTAKFLVAGNQKARQQVADQARCMTDHTTTDPNFDDKAKAVLDALARAKPAPFVQPDHGTAWGGSALEGVVPR